MKIISKFKDYYDSGAAYGIDNERIFIRNTQTHKLTDIEVKSLNKKNKYYKYDKYLKTYYNNTLFDSCGKFVYIGYCGKIIPVLRLEGVKKDKSNIFHDENVVDYIYDDFLKKTLAFCLKYFDPYYKFSYKPNYSFSKNDKKNQDKIKFFLDISFKNMEFIINSKILINLFDRFNTPIFYTDLNEVIINPVLKDYKFFRHKHVLEIFNDIELFIGNYLTNKDQIKVPVGGDKIIAESKGFDKYSFRKEPSKKKHRKINKKNK